MDGEHVFADRGNFSPIYLGVFSGVFLQASRANRVFSVNYGGSSADFLPMRLFRFAERASVASDAKQAPLAEWDRGAKVPPGGRDLLRKAFSRRLGKVPEIRSCASKTQSNVVNMVRRG
jgi:hypothetical protein